MTLRILTLFSFIFSFSISYAQNYVPPLNIPLVLSGNFGEIRSNHFHTGLDIKTQGRTGLPVFSIADGDVVRIKVSPYGYGKALYIKHADGNTSVYGHLESFHPNIAEWVERQQYAKQSYSIDVFPQAGQFSFQQGSEIGKSGNSGSSGGPHLHFEIRDTKTEEPMNPLNFPFKVTDTSPPSIYGMQVYAMDDNSHVNKKAFDNFSMGGTHGNYQLKADDKIEVNGNIGFSVHTIDRLNAANNKCGVYDLTLVIGKDTVYQALLDRVNFATNRYINAHIDFNLYKRFRKHYHRLFKVENNKLDIYKQLKNNGVVNFSKDEDFPCTLIVKDVGGNESVLNFTVHSKAEKHTRIIPANPNEELVNCSSAFEWKSEVAATVIPANCLYFDDKLTFESKNREDGLPQLQVADKYTAAQTAFVVKLKIPEQLQGLESNLFLGKVADNNRVYADNTGNIENGWFVAKNREFGTYTLLVDTIAPSAKAMSFYNGKEVRNKNKIRFRIKDSGSGIGTYNMYIDDQWVLASYDFRTGAVEYVFDANRIDAGKHMLKLVVEDKIGNAETQTFNFTSY